MLSAHDSASALSHTDSMYSVGGDEFVCIFCRYVYALKKPGLWEKSGGLVARSGQWGQWTRKVVKGNTRPFKGYGVQQKHCVTGDLKDTIDYRKTCSSLRDILHDTDLLRKFFAKRPY
jgi:hypothetical protein